MALCSKCGKDIQIHEAVAYLGYCHTCNLAARMEQRRINKELGITDDATNHYRMEIERRKRIAEVKASFKPKKMGE